MSDPVIPITAKKLTERWEVEPIEILFLMMTHNLSVIDQFGEGIPIEVVLENYEENDNFDITSLMFRLSDVEKLEDETLGEFLFEKRDVIRGQSLMERWQMHEAEVFMIAFQEGWEFVDPFGFPIEYNLALTLWNKQTFSIADALFRLSDVEKFEEGSAYKIPRSEEKAKPSEQDVSLLISFFKNGQMWYIGKQGEEKVFNHLKGFDRIRFLIANEGKEFESKVVFHLGKQPVEDDRTNIGHLPAGVQISAFDKVITSAQDEEDEEHEVNTGFRLEGFKQELLDRVSVKEIEGMINHLKDLMDGEQDQEKWLEYEKKLEILETHLKKAKNKWGKIGSFRQKDQENPRLAVLKSMQKALQVIHQNLPYMAEFINKDSLVTGDKCSYRPDKSHAVRWILDPPPSI